MSAETVTTESAHSAVLAARKVLAELDAEDKASAELLRKVAVAPRITPDDVAARENVKRRRARLVTDYEKATSSYIAARTEERAAVQAADGIETVFGDLLGPGDLASRSSFTVVESPLGTPGPRPIPAGSRVRAVAGLGVQVVLPDAPTDEVLQFAGVRPDHPVVTARVIERPEGLGQKGVEGVLLSVGAAAPGPQSAVSGSTVRTLRLVCGARGVLGLRVEADRGALLLPAWNVAWLKLDEPDLAGEHYLLLGGWRSIRLLPGATVADAIRPWAAPLEEMPRTRVTTLEAREGHELSIGRSEWRHSVVRAADLDVSMETAGDAGVTITHRGSAELVPWRQIKAAELEG